jgi:phosphate uptake regulator
MKFEDKYFAQFRFSGEQIEKSLNNAIKDLEIAKTVNILDVKFNYAYVALIKAGIALLSFHRVRIKSVPGHQVKIISPDYQER